MIMDVLQAGGLESGRSRLVEFTDADLMTEFASGVEQAFTVLVDRYSKSIINFANRYLGDRHRAEDIAQEAFVRVYLHRHRYRAEGKFSSWLLSITANLAKNELRDRSRPQRDAVSMDDLQAQWGEIDPSFVDQNRLPDERAADTELADFVAAALKRLPARFRQPVILRDLHGLSYGEISRALKIPSGTVRSRINRGRLQLKDYLKFVLPGDFGANHAEMEKPKRAGAAVARPRKAAAPRPIPLLQELGVRLAGSFTLGEELLRAQA